MKLAGGMDMNVRMRDDLDVLAINRLPARLSVAQTAALLGMHPADIQILVRQRLLKPLGRPPANGSKFFAATTVLAVAADALWLGRASDWSTTIIPFV